VCPAASESLLPAAQHQVLLLPPPLLVGVLALMLELPLRLLVLLLELVLQPQPLLLVVLLLLLLASPWAHPESHQVPTECCGCRSAGARCVPCSRHTQ
jgi:hypothetical protein